MIDYTSIYMCSPINSYAMRQVNLSEAGVIQNWKMINKKSDMVTQFGWIWFM